MRLVLIVPCFPKLSETFIVSKFLGLLERGWDVHVVCGESREAEWRHFPELIAHPAARRRVHVCWPHRPRWLAAALTPLAGVRCMGRNPAGSWRYLARGASRFGTGVVRHGYLDAELLCLRPDVLHFEFGALAVDSMYLKDLLGCRVVVSFRGYDVNYCGLEASAFFDAVWQHSDHLHFLGEDLWRRAQQRGCPPDKPHTLIAPALNKRFAKAMRSPAPPADALQGAPVRILSVGRLEWKKGYEHAVQAIGLLRDRGVECEYRVIGQGNYLEPVTFAQHQCAAAGIQFLGAIPPAEVVGELASAAIFLHSAVSEGFCNAVIEAQAMGLPVVCTDADGLPENVVDGVTGFVVPRRDPHALADKLALLARDPELRQRLGRAGRQRALEHFRLEDQLAKFEALYRQVLSAKPALSPTSAPTS